MFAIETPSRIAVEPPLVHDLIKEQFPELADLPINRLGSTGTENAVYRLGESALVRLPATESAAKQVSKEQQWLPRLARVDLPLAIPKLMAAGTPSATYPYKWSIYKWLKGKPATTERITDIRHAAELLGQFVARLQTVVTDGAPVPGEHNFFRGVPLAERDDATQEAFRRLREQDFNVTAASRIWDEAVAAPVWNGPPVWIHGDLADSNMLAKRRKEGDRRELNAVIDFGGMAVGDPACDLLVGWDVVAGARDAFFEAAGADDTMIRRGRGWAVSTAAISLVRFPDKPAITACALRKLDQATLSSAA